MSKHENAASAHLHHSIAEPSLLQTQIQLICGIYMQNSAPTNSAVLRRTMHGSGSQQVLDKRHQSCQYNQHIASIRPMHSPESTSDSPNMSSQKSPRARLSFKLKLCHLSSNIMIWLIHPACFVRGGADLADCQRSIKIGTQYQIKGF